MGDLGGIDESRADEAVAEPRISTDIMTMTDLIGRRNIPVGVVDLALGTQKLLLARLVGVVPTDLVAVFLSLEEGSEVQTRPHLLTGKLAIDDEGVQLVIDRISRAGW